MARRNRAVNTFNLSFLDCMCCGFGAVVLFFFIINANASQRKDLLKSDLQARADTLELEVDEERRRKGELTAALRETEEEEKTAEARQQSVSASLAQLSRDLERLEQETLADTEHIEKLKADLKSLDADSRRLQAAVESEERVGPERPPPRGRRRPAVSDRNQGGRKAGLHSGGRVGQHARRDHRQHHPSPEHVDGEQAPIPEVATDGRDGGVADDPALPDQRVPALRVLHLRGGRRSKGASTAGSTSATSRTWTKRSGDSAKVVPKGKAPTCMEPSRPSLPWSRRRTTCSC